MRILRVGSRGSDVIKLQHFLIGGVYLRGNADGVFGNMTKEAVKDYQLENGLRGDGVVGPKTLAIMVSDGFSLITGDIETEKPTFGPLVGNSQRQAIFGKFDFVPAPTSENPEGIRILGNWESQNIVSVDLPQLAKATGGQYTRMRFHKKAADQLRGLWKAWENEGLLHLVKTYEGAFYPRYVRGSRSTLSNHSWGTAFDINYWWNRLGRTPAYKGQEGSVRELVPLAHNFGFYWGGHFSRKDGMHFEVAKIV